MTVSTAFAEALRHDAGILERHADDAAEFAVRLARESPGQKNNAVDVLLRTIASMRETAAKLRTTADFFDAAVASGPSGPSNARAVQTPVQSSEEEKLD